ncbi:S24 family peptidase [Rhizobium sp. IMFF44]|uniref:LexA family transcriptional regulator n=1 Tax=Rhizobium sp. IMFF44 TaxID=3342350 RepID=UPI0035B738A3
MSDIWKTRLKKALEDKGLSMKAASLEAGKGETFIRDLFERDRAPSIDNFLAIARVVGRSASYLLGENTDVPEGLRSVEVGAPIQAGAWSETWEWDYDERYTVMVPDYPEYRPYRLYAAEARGTSMNRRYQEGTVLVFVDVNETGESPMPGKRYIVERKRASGEAEHTVKLLFADQDGKLWLMPESDDPRFQAAIAIEDGAEDGDVVAIVGRVIAAVTKE